MLDLRPFLSIPYKHKGRGFNGADCYGFIILFYRSILGKELFDVSEDYSSSWSFKNKNYFIENYHRQFERVEKPKEYDIILFQNRNGIANHGGVVLSYGRFIHCSKIGTAVDSYTRPELQKRLNGFYRMKE